MCWKRGAAMGPTDVVGSESPGGAAFFISRCFGHRWEWCCPSLLIKFPWVRNLDCKMAAKYRNIGLYAVENLSEWLDARRPSAATPGTARRRPSSRLPAFCTPQSLLLSRSIQAMTTAPAGRLHVARPPAPALHFSFKSGSGHVAHGRYVPIQKWTGWCRSQANRPEADIPYQHAAWCARLA
jgi:hypothetical protein